MKDQNDSSKKLEETLKKTYEARSTSEQQKLDRALLMNHIEQESLLPESENSQGGILEELEAFLWPKSPWIATACLALVIAASQISGVADPGQSFEVLTEPLESSLVLVLMTQGL